MVELDPATQKGPDGLDSFGWLRLNKELGKTDYGQFLSIIQHPGGQPKQIAIRENLLLPFEDAELFLTYRSDTFRGSSGSPVFNDYWDVVALHHSGKPAKDAQGHYIGHDDQPIVESNSARARDQMARERRRSHEFRRERLLGPGPWRRCSLGH